MFSTSKVSRLIDTGRLAVENARLPEIAVPLERYGYGLEENQEGQTHWEALKDAQDAHLRLYGEQKAATAAFRAAFKTARDYYMRLSKIARAQLADRPDLWNLLGLDGARARTFSEWQPQARALYNALLDPASEMSVLLSPVGLTPEAAQEGLTLLEAALAAETAQEAIKGAAQQATQTRHEAALAFQAWLRNFWKVAEVALADTPQWLEQLGRTVKS